MTEDTIDSPGSAGPRSAFVTLGRILLADQPLEQTLHEVAELTRQVLPDICDVSMTMVDGAHAWSAVYTGPVALELDERQYGAGFGPCLDAAASGRSIVVTSAGTNPAYGDFARLAHRAGISHVLSVRLPAPRRVVGALNIYAKRAEPFDDAEVELAETFATFAAVAVTNAASHSSTLDLEGQMLGALRSRNLIEQARGILMARHRCSALDAFDALLTTAREQDRPILAAAQSVVDGVRA